MQKLFIEQAGDTLQNGGAFKRWLYRGQKPGLIAKFLNRMMANKASTEIPVGERAPFLKAYLCAAPGAHPHVAVDMDASIEEFEKVAADYPVFRVTSR